MKKLKRILTLLIAMVMVLGMSTSIFAAEVDSGKGGSASIIITLPTSETTPTTTTTYKIYKVFDGSSDGKSEAISYTSRQGETMPEGFVLDTAGNVHHGTKDANGNITENPASALTPDEINAIAAYVRTPADLVYTAEVQPGETQVTITGLEYGYYYITTSSGTVVTVNSTNPNANVTDKNILPIVKKSAGTEYDENSLMAIAAVGTSQYFTAQINVGKGTQNLVFTDTMTKMNYNEDVIITVSKGSAPNNEQAVVRKTDNGFTVTFENDYIAKLDENTIITLVYSGTITDDALYSDPARNIASITSGEGNSSTSKEIQVYNAKFEVFKKDSNDRPLSGAGFVIAQVVADTSEEAAEGATKTVYYKLADDKKSISWVENIEQATEYTSNDEGYVTAFTGLGNGTYILIEKTVPAGYNKADDYTFTVNAVNYDASELQQSTTVFNNTGSVLPSTGGIGTTMFYVIGGALVLVAVVLLVTRKRMSAEK